MAFFDVLQMNKPKIVLFLILMVAFFPSYYGFSCTTPACSLVPPTAECFCGFSITYFFVCFVWAYLIACVVVEVAYAVRKKRNKSN